MPGLLSHLRLMVLCCVVSLTLCKHPFQPETLDGVESETEVMETLNNMMDSILEDLTMKYDNMKADDFWHPYDFGTGNNNREAIRVSSMSQHHIPGDFLQWHKVKLGVKQHIVGLEPNSISVHNSKLERIMSIELPKKTLKAMDVYTRWDSVKVEPFIVILVATSDPSILVFKSVDGNLKEIGSFPLHAQVKSIMLGQVDNTDTIVLIPENSQSSVSIYNVEITSDDLAQLWFFQHLSEPGFKSVIVHRPDSTRSNIIISRKTHLNVYQFDEQLGQYTIQQKLDTTEETECTDMFAFTMTYQHYIGCTSTDDVTSADIAKNAVHFFNYNPNSNEYERSASLNNVEAEEMHPINIEGAREDMIFISKATQSDSAHDINVLTHDGQNQFDVDHQCTLEACSNLASFSKGASFVYNDMTAFVFPTNADPSGAPVLVFFTEVWAKTSPVFKQSMGLFGVFKHLSERMNAWNLVVTSAENTLSKKINVDGDNVITGDWTVKSISAEDVSVEGRNVRSDDVFNVLKFGDVPWTEEDFAITNEQILDRMANIDENLAFMRETLSNALLKNAPGPQMVSSEVVMSGMITARNVEIKNYDGTLLWERDASQFFQNLAHKEKNLEILGGLTFVQPPTINKLQTKMLNEVAVADMARLSADNKFRCRSTFDSIESLGDIHATSVNSLNLLEAVVMADDIQGFKFTDGIVAYKGAETEEHFPFDQVLLSSISQTVKSPMVFDTVEIHSPVAIGSLNDQDFQHFSDKIVFRNFEGKIRGTKTFSRDIKVDTLFMSSWNGLDFPGAFFTPKDTDIHLGGSKSFQKLNADELFVANKIDGVSTKDLVTLSGFHEVQSTWTFNGPTKIEKDIRVEKMVDGIMMESLLHQGILDSRAQHFNPNADFIVFKQPVFIEKLHVRDTMNDKDFDELFNHVQLFDGKTCSIPGITTMLGEVVFQDLNLNHKKINGFSIHNFLTKDTPQEISSPVVFSGSTSFHELVALGHLDTLQISQVLSEAARISGPMTIPYDVHFESISCQDKFIVEGPINGVINYKNSVARTGGIPVQTFTGSVSMSNPTFETLSTDHLSLDHGRTLQTLDVDHWNITRAKLSEPGFFSKPFKLDNILVESNLDAVNINGIPISHLQNEVLRSDRQFQEFSGPVQILNGMMVLNGDVNFLEKLDGFFLDDFVQHGFPRNAKNDEPIVVHHAWKFQNLKITHGLDLDGSNVCGVNLNHLLQDSVKRSDHNLHVSGEKNFVQPLEIRNSLDASHINGKSMDKVFHLTKDNQDIEHLATFNSDVSKNKLDVDNINNVEVSWLSKMYSFNDGQHVLNHDVQINERLITDSIQIQGKIQDKDFEEFLTQAYKHSDPNIKFDELVTLEAPMVSHGNIQVGTYNGINLHNLANEVVHLNEDHVIDQEVSFQGTIHARDLVLGGDIQATTLANGLDWDDLKKNAIRINGPRSELNLGSMHFESVIASAPIQVSRLNSVPFGDYATLTGPQHLGTLKVKVAHMESSNAKVNGKTGHVKIADEFKDTLMRNAKGLQRLTGDMSIKGPMHIKNNMNCFGPDLKKNVLTTHEDIVLQGPVEFMEPLIVRKDMTVSDTIQGHTVESIFSSIFSTDTDVEQVISEKWEFHGPVTFLHNFSGPGLTDTMNNIQALVQEKEKDLKEAHMKVEEERSRFLKRCASLTEIGRKVGSYPVKLDSFDLHQAISVPTEAKNILTVETKSHENALLLVQTSNCQLLQYQWHTDMEIFHNVVNTPYIIGQVESWQAISLNEGSIIVLSKGLSDCSKQEGLFSIMVSENGDLSPTTTISFKDVKSFKLIEGTEEEGKAMLFAIFHERSNELDVFEWESGTFVQKAIIRFASEMERVDVTPTSSGMGILCHNKEELHMYQYSRSENLKILLEGSSPILASSSAPMTFFQNIDTTYALVPEAGTTATLIQPTCNYQLMRFSSTGKVESLQKLQIPEVQSSTHWQFAKKNFIAFLSKSHGVTIYKFKGLNGFEVLSAPLQVYDGFMLRSFSVKKSGSGFTMAQPFLLALSSNRIEIFRGNVFGDKFTADLQNLCEL